MINKYLFIVVFLVVNNLPVSGFTRLSLQPPAMFEAGTLVNDKSSLRPPGGKFGLFPAIILFMPQQGIDDAPKPFGNLVNYFITFLGGLGLGYLSRHNRWFWPGGHKRRTKQDDNSSWPPGVSPGVLEGLSDFSLPQPVLPVTATPEIDKLPEETVNESAYIPEGKPKVVELPVTNKMPNAKPIDTLYFPNPNNDGNFRKADGRENFTEGASIYKFKLTKQNEAKFEFCQEQSSVSMALNNRDHLILSVADEVNNYNSGARQILIADNKFGIAMLEGTIWTVKTKAKIKYV